MEAFELKLKVSETGVETNVDEIAATVLPALEKYQYPVSTENYASAKKDMAALRKVVSASRAERSRIKNKLLESWKGPEAKLMELEKQIEAVISGLDRQVKALDDEAKKRTYQKYEEYWNELCKSVTPFRLVFDESYLKKSVSDRDVKKDLDSKWEKILDIWKPIEKALPGNPATDRQIKELYFRTLDTVSVWERLDSFKAVLDAEYTEKPEESQAASDALLEVTETPEIPEDRSRLVRQWTTSGTVEQYEALYNACLQIGIEILDVQKLN